MPEWLNHAFEASPIQAGTMALRLLMATAFGVAVAAIYRATHGRSSREANILSATLVLLCILLAMVSMVIGESIARAFGLVGALSIVRFRTVVQDTRDTAFVIFAVIVGMAVGTGLVLVPAIGVPVVAAAAWAMNRRSVIGTAASNEPEMILTVRLSLGKRPDAVLGPVLSRMQSHRLTSVSTARQGSAIDVSYRLTVGAGHNPADLVQELNAIDGVQSAELRDASLES